MRILGKLLTVNLLTLGSAASAVVAVERPPSAGPVVASAPARPAETGPSQLDISSAIEIASHAVRREGDALVVSDPAYEARFERDGFSLDALTIASRGTDAAWTPIRNQAQRSLASGMLERVTARDGEVEWDVVLTRAQTGDVRIVADVRGRMRAADSAIRVVTQDGSHFTIGELIVLDADGRELYRTLPSIDGSRLTLEVPARALKGARYPVVLDPVVTPETSTPAGPASPDYGGGFGFQADFDGGNHLVVWTDSRNGNHDIYGARISESGDLIDPAGFPIATGSHDEAWPHVAFGDGHFLVVWEDLRSGSSDLYAARVDRDGTVRSGQLAVCTAAGSQRRPRVAWSATASAFLAVWEDGRIANTNIYATRINTSGVVTPNGAAITDSTEPDTVGEVAARSAGGWLVAWQRSNDVRRTTVSTTGTVGALNGTPYGFTASASETLDDLALEGGASHLYLAYGTVGPFPDYSQNVIGRRLTATGDLSGAADDLGGYGGAPVSVSANRDGDTYLANGTSVRIVYPWGTFFTDTNETSEVSMGIERGLAISVDGSVQPLDANGDPQGDPFAIVPQAPEQRGPAAAFDGQQYLVVWAESNEIRGVRIAADGTLLDDAPLVIAQGYTLWPSVTADAGGFLVTYGLGVRIVARRVSPSGVVDPTDIILDDAQATSASASTGSRTLVVWTRDNDVRGAIVDSNGVVLNSPITISNAAGQQLDPSVASDGTGFFVTWTDARNGVTDIYGTRVTAAGTVSDPSGIAISSQTAPQTEPSIGFSEGSYQVAWTDARNGGTDVYASRVTTAGAVSDPAGIAVASGAAAESAPTVIGDGVRTLIAFQAGGELRAQRLLAGSRRDTSLGFLVGSGGTVPALAGGPTGRRLVTYLRSAAEAPYHGENHVFTRFIDENDQFAGAFTLSGAGGSGRNVAYSLESGEPTHVANVTGGNSAWWNWTAPGYGTATLHTNGSTYDTTLAVYTGSEVGSLTQLVSDDDAGDGNASLVTLPVSGGTTYRVAVDGFSGATGSIVLSASFTPDTTAPDTLLGAGPTATNQSTLTFSFTATESGSSFACSLDGDAFSACTSPITYQGLTDGQHAFAVRATDLAGNTDASPATRTVTIDRTAPDTVLDSGPSGTVNATSATFGFTATEAGSSFSCSLDGAPFEWCSSPHPVSSLSQGSHTFQVRATDPAGNLDQVAASRTWTVDTIAPDVSITAGPSGTVGAADVTFSFSGTEPLTSATCTIDGGSSACTSPVTYAGLSNGSHTFTVTGSDAAGNADPSPATRTFTVDSNLPETVIDSGPASTIATSSTSISFSSTKAGSTFSCSIDSGPLAACTSPRSVGPLTDGTHTFQVAATDATGHTDPTPATRTFTIDTRAPDTSITSGPQGPSNSAEATIAFASDESGATFECRLDAGAYTACVSPSAYSALSEGAHTVLVRARDAAGNLDASPASRAFTVDVTAPPTTLSSSSVTQATATFTFSSTDATATFSCSLDGAAFAACVSPKAYNGLADGNHTFEVRAGDPAGNLDATPATSSVLIDTLAPDTTITAGPTGATNDATAEVSFVASETGSTFRCAVDAGAFATCTSPFTTSTLTTGEHTILVRAVDAAGNLDPSPATRTFIVDTTAPTAGLTGPSGAFASQQLSYTLSANEAGVRYECRLDAGTFATCASPWTLTGVSEGVHTVSVRAIDAAGNTGAAATATVTVDVTAPDTTVTGPTGAISGRDVAWSFASEAGASFRCVLDGGDAAACTSPRSYLGLSDGPHSFEVFALDPAGNADASPASRVVTVDTTAPDTTISGGPSGTVNSTTATFTVTGSEASVTLVCRLDGTVVACGADHTGLTAGSHTFTATASDVSGNVDPTPASRTWTIDLSGPDTFISTGPNGSVSSTTASFTFGSDEASSFQCALDAGAFAACGSGISYSALAQGSHTFRVRALDVGGNLDASPASRTWTVDTVTPDTTITAGPATTIAATSTTISFSSPDASSTFACALDTAAFEPCTSPVALAGLSQGEHGFRVRALDAAGNTDATPASRTFTVDTQGPTVTITAATLTGNDLSVTFTTEAGAMAGCALDDSAFASCSSPFTVADLGDGSHLIRIRATDAAGNTGAASERSVSVDTTAPETTIEGTLEGASVTTVFASDDASSSFRCALDADTLAPCANPRTFSGLSQGAHSVRVAAVDPTGNIDATPATYAFSVDTIAPDTTITSAPPMLTSTTSATFTFTGSEANTTFRCSLDGAAPQVCASPRTFAGLGQGTHTVTVAAADAVGNADPSPAESSFTVDSVAPDTSIVSAPPELSNATSATVRFASSEQGSSFRCRLDDGPTTVCSSPHTVTGLSDGTHLVRIGAFDATGNTDPTPAQVTFTVDTVAPDTVITSGPPALSSSRSVSFGFASEDPDASFRCALDDAPYTACSSPTQVSDLSPGTHTMRVRAIDRAGNLDPTPATRTWTFDASTVEIAFTRPTPGTWVLDQQVSSGGPVVVAGAVTIEVRAVDGESGISAFTLEVDGVPVPAGEITVDPQTGRYRHLYRGGPPGVHTVTARAVNGTGVANSATIQIVAVG